MIHQSLRNHQSSSNFMVEVIGWKGDDMVRMEDSGLGLQDSLLTAMDYLSIHGLLRRALYGEAHLSIIYLI